MCLQIELLRYDDIAFVRPEWRLSVDDHKCPPGVYVALDLKWHKLELEGHAYRFAFMFEDQDDTDEALSQPLKVYPNGDEE